MASNLDQFPNIFLTTLAQSLALNGNETEVYLSSITTLDGQPMETSDFALLGRGVLSVDVQSASRAEFISFKSVDPSGVGVTDIVRGLSFKNDSVIAANIKFHAVGAPVIIAFGTHNLRDIERLIEAGGGSTVIVNTGGGSTGNTPANSLTFPMTTSGNNRGIAVQVNTTHSVTVESVTFDDLALTQQGAIGTDGATIQTSQWFLVNPPAGTFNVVITLASSATANITAGSEALQNVNQGTPVGAIATPTTGSSTSPLVALTTEQTNSIVLDSLVTAVLPIIYVPNDNQDVSWVQNTTPDAIQGISSSQGEGTAPIDVTMGYTITPSTAWAMTAMEIIPSGNDQFVKVNSDDSTAGYLQQKLTMSSNNGTVVIDETVVNPGGNEVLNFDLSAIGGGGGGTKLAIDTTEVIVTDTTTETNLYTVSIPANTLGTNDGIRFTILANVNSNNSFNDTVLVKVYYGGELCTVTGNLTNPTDNTFSITGIIVADNATDAQKAVVQFQQGANGSPNQFATGYGAASIDSTVTQDLIISVTLGSTSDTITAEGIVVEQFSSPQEADTFPFTYGETISSLQYVFLSSGGSQLEIVFNDFFDEQSLTSVSDFVGQPFTTSPIAQTIISATIELAVDNTSGISGTLALQLYATSGGLPTGSVLATTNTVNVSELTTILSYITFTFATPPSISGSTQYALVLNTAGITFSGRTILYAFADSTGPSFFTSNNGGTSFTSAGLGALQSTILQGITGGSVYLVDITTPFPDMGPYIGFALEDGVEGNSKNVQIGGVVDGFSGLTIGGNVYIDPSTPGNITQTETGAGRAIGLAISPTQIQLYQMKKRDAGRSYSSGQVINQDGFLIIQVYTGSSLSFSVTETNGVSSNEIVTASSAFGTTITIPVRPGYSYNYGGSASPTNSTFYPIING